MPFERHTARHYSPRPSWGKQATVLVNGIPVPAWQAAEIRKKEQSK